MALPTLVKTWQYSANNQILAQGSAIANNRRLYRSIKNALLAMASNPPTVGYSCNGTTSGSANDGVDRWTTDADLVFGTTPPVTHSWFVFKFAGIASGFQFLFDLVTGNTTGTTQGSFATLVVSPSAGFTGGTTTARPTATDEIIINATGAASQISAIITDIASRWTVWLSSDGQCAMVWVAAAGTTRLFWLIEKPGNPTTGWTIPWVALQLTSTAISDFTAYNGKMRHGINGNVAFGCETAGSVILPSDTTSGAVANEISSEWPMLPVGFCCNTVGIKGRHGTLQDIFFGSVNIATGDTYPNDASNQFVQIGVAILPWNGGAVNLS